MWVGSEGRWAVRTGRNREGLPRGEQGEATQQDQAELEPVSTECRHQPLCSVLRERLRRGACPRAGFPNRES